MQSDEQRDYYDKRHWEYQALAQQCLDHVHHEAPNHRIRNQDRQLARHPNWHPGSATKGPAQNTPVCRHRLFCHAVRGRLKV